MENKNPFSYPPLTFLGVFALSALAGAVKYLNKSPTDQLSIVRLLIEVVTSMFSGLLTFWLCEFAGIYGPLSAVLIAVAGLMGSRAWDELENLWKVKLLASNIRIEDIQRTVNRSSHDSERGD